MRKQKPFNRSHGILMPIFSLSSDYGIGTLGGPSKRFIDFLYRAGCNMWQMLPLGPTGYGDSPYQCFSAFAGNPYFLDPEWFFKKGWITEEILNKFKSQNKGAVDYGYLYKTRKPLLERVFEGFLRFATADSKRDFEEYTEKNKYWLSDYSFYMALKECYGNVGREDFLNFNLKSEDALDFCRKELRQRLKFFAFLEYAFDAQWQELKGYAKEKNILLVGDIPLYVSNDSADVWANPELFLLDEKGKPTLVAGVPPDMFSAEGQLWGNPIYNWENHKKQSYLWWSRRIARQSEFFDVIRIDHFIGICRYYAIPYGAENAKVGSWREGPSKNLTDVFIKSGKSVKFIAEDLGLVTKEVKSLIKSTGFPGMRLMEFAFSGEDNPNMPHNIPKNSVVYTGTHDNQTAVGFFINCPTKIRQNAKKYMNLKQSGMLAEGIIRECHKSAANTVIIPLYDYLGLDDSARINTPSTSVGNWTWRISKDPSNMLADEIYALSEIYKRNNRKPKTPL